MIENVMKEINWAIDCINYFVDPTIIKPDDVDFSHDDKNIIDNVTNTINNWNTLCEHSVTIDPNIQFITQTNTQLHNKTSVLINTSNILKMKLNSYLKHK